MTSPKTILLLTLILLMPVACALLVSTTSSSSPLSNTLTPTRSLEGGNVSLLFVSGGVWEYYQTATPARDVAIDRNGNIWAVGDKAFITIWDTTNRTASQLQFPSSNDPRALLGYDTVKVNNQGEAWISRTNFFIARYKDTDFQILNYNSPFAFSFDESIWATGSLPQTNAKLSPRKTFLARFDQERWEEYHIDIEDKVSSMAVAPDGSVWVSLSEWADEGEEFSKGVWRFDAGRLMPIPELQDEFVFYELVRAPDGHIWSIGHPHSLSFDSHFAHIKVFDGNKWILDFENPVRISDPTFDSKGNLWAISSYDFRIMRFEQDRWIETFTLSDISQSFDNLIKPNIIYSLDFHEDTLCLGADKGVYCRKYHSNITSNSTLVDMYR